MADAFTISTDVVQDEWQSRMLQEILEGPNIFAGITTNASANATQGVKALNYPFMSQDVTEGPSNIPDDGGATSTELSNFSIDNEELDLDQNKGLAVRIADRVSIQSVTDLESFVAERMAFQMARQLDDYLIDRAFETTNTISTSEPISKQALIDLRVDFDKREVPDADRTLVVSPDGYGSILADPGLDLIKVNSSGSEAGLRRGEVGTLLGFSVRVCNNPYFYDPGAGRNADSWVALVPAHVIWAVQMTRVEQEREAKAHATDYVSSALYGAKMMNGGVYGTKSQA